MNQPTGWRAVAITLAMTAVLLACAFVAGRASAGTHGRVTRQFSPVHCHPITCAQRLTVTRPYLDTDATMTVVMRRIRPAESRTPGLVPPWRPWRVQFGFIR